MSHIITPNLSELSEGTTIYDPATNTWSYDPLSPLSPLSPLYSAYDPVTNTYTYTQNPSSQTYSTYDPVTNTYTYTQNPNYQYYSSTNFSDFSDSTPYTPSVDLSYSYPQVGFYQDMNKDEKVRKLVTKKYRSKTLEVWLEDDIDVVLNYLVIRDGKVRLLDSLSKYDKSEVNKNSEQEIQDKIQFIKKNVLTYEFMRKTLKKFNKEYGIKWLDIHKKEKHLKKFIKNRLINAMKKKINN